MVHGPIILFNSDFIQCPIASANVVFIYDLYLEYSSTLNERTDAKSLTAFHSPTVLERCILVVSF